MYHFHSYVFSIISFLCADTSDMMSGKHEYTIGQLQNVTKPKPKIVGLKNSPILYSEQPINPINYLLYNILHYTPQPEADSLHF